ncbi:MAG: ABC transporter ATP-binding protein [Trueperaceae bacterium]
MADVVLKNVTKRFGKVTAVHELSLEIKNGEFVVLLGPTGAGKTTTLRMIAGLEKLDGGTLHIAGQDVTTTPIADHDVAFVFQQYSLYPHYNVFDNLAFPLRSPLRRESEDVVRKKVTEIAETLHIESKLQNKATRLSGGEMQRVAIGRALVRDPNIFLMDEPLSSLDAKLREELRVELKRIQIDRNATILYVTHDQVEAMTLADKIGVLEEGRLVQIGTPKEVYTKPNSVYVAQRLGSPAMNVLPVGLLETPAPAGVIRVGVRPENVRLGAEGKRAKVVKLEALGGETVIVLDVEGQHVEALSDIGSRWQVGQETNISVPPQHSLYFDERGQRVEVA